MGTAGARLARELVTQVLQAHRVIALRGQASLQQDKREYLAQPLHISLQATDIASAFKDEG
jgi:hypothetical protein